MSVYVPAMHQRCRCARGVKRLLVHTKNNSQLRVNTDDSFQEDAQEEHERELNKKQFRGLVQGARQTCSLIRKDRYNNRSSAKDSYITC